MKEYEMYLTQEELDVLTLFVGTSSNFGPHEEIYRNMYRSLYKFTCIDRINIYTIVDDDTDYISIDSSW